MNKNAISTIAAVVFALLVIGGYCYIWIGSNSAGNVANDAIADISTGVADISGIKEEALKLTSGKENNAGIPIPVPSTKIGNDNPYANR